MTDVFEHDDGRSATHPQEIENLDAAGYMPCRNPRCDFHISPEAQQDIPMHGEYDCPRCQSRYYPYGTVPFARDQETALGTPVPKTKRKMNGITHSGLSLTEIGQLGEDLIQEQGQLPGYGPFTWWSPVYHSPLDGAVEDWGIEVKAIDKQGKHQKFVAGKPFYREQKNKMAATMGKKGVLSVLVVLDFVRSVADVYVREHLLEPWRAGNGKMVTGIANYHKSQAPRILEEIPFKNPFLDPHHDTTLPNPETPFD